MGVEAGYTGAKLSSVGNWFGSSDAQTIANMTYDQTNNLNAPSIIQNIAPLTAPASAAWNIVEALPGSVVPITSLNTVYYGTPYQYWGLSGSVNKASTAQWRSVRLSDIIGYSIQSDASLSYRGSSGGIQLVGFKTIQLADVTLTLSAASGSSTLGSATVSYNSGYWSSAEAGFDRAYYLRNNPDVAAAGVDPLTHFQQYGWREGRNPDGWFDSSYYLTQNPDVKKAGIDPLLHFEQFGWREGRAPSLLFDDAKYLAANSDVAVAGVEPLQHFLQSGQVEGRLAFLTGGTTSSEPLIDTAYYDKQLGATLIPSGTAGNQQAAWSYNATGWQNGLNPDTWFDTSYYLSHNPDVAAAHINPLTHYETFGWKEGRDPSPVFSTNRYLAANLDVKAAGLDPLLHYIAFGQAEGRAIYATSR